VAPGNKLPPSLRNIFKELARDAGHTLDAKPWPLPCSGSLVSWARQGVLLLNTCLTVEEARPASHSGQGWGVLTGAIIDAVAAKNDRVVFMLWGAHAQTLLPHIQALCDVQGGIGRPGNHLVLTANHPSPLSARRPPQPFIGCGHFSTANEFLRQSGQQPVSW
jgi:uracil-DNA glycosylase